MSRPLYFYVKKAHLGVIPGLQEYIDFFVSDDIAGPDGPLAAYGLVPDPELAATQAAVAAGTADGPAELIRQTGWRHGATRPHFQGWFP